MSSHKIYFIIKSVKFTLYKELKGNYLKLSYDVGLKRLHEYCTS